MNFEVHADGVFFGPKTEWRCALGRGGVAPMGTKREGDGATPAGLWPLRRLLYRPDRLSTPKTRLPITAIERTDGWCDASGNPSYNQLVTLPYPASAENLWRQDGVYDLIVILGYNDAPVVPGRGSAIFLHIARPDYSPTEGCVALAEADLLTFLEDASPWDALCIHAAPARTA